MTESQKTLQDQSFKWFYDYQKITQFIEIVFDYVYDSKEELKKIIGAA